MPNREKWIFYSEKLPYSERNFVIGHEIGHDVLGHVAYGQILGKSKNTSDKVSESLQEKEADAFALALLAPPAVLLELNCCSPREISKVTGLPSDMSDLAAIEVINEQSMKKTKLESRLLNVFSESIEKHRYIQEKQESKTKQEPIIITIPSETISKPKTNHNFVIFSAISSSVAIVLFILFLNYTFNPPTSRVNTYNKENTYSLEESTKNNNDIDTTVYVSSTKKYHLKNCRFAKDGIPTPLSEAVKNNYTPCKVCNPDK